MASTESANANGVSTEEQPTSSTSNAQENSTPKSSIVGEDGFKLAVNFLLQGKRFLVIKDFLAAIDSLGESCRMLSDVEMKKTSSFEYAEAHFFYGKALLEQSRLELGVLETPDVAKSEDASDDESEDDEEKSDEEEDDNEEVDGNNEVGKSGDEAESSEAAANGVSNDKMDESEPLTSTAQESAVTSTNEAKSKNDVQDQDVDLNAPSPSVSSGQVVDREVPSTSSGLTAEVVAEKQEEEELSNLELGWEVLEVAKNGYRNLLNELSLKKATLDSLPEEDQKKMLEQEGLIKKRLADTHCSLGEVATESENYNQAIDEFKTGLDILNEIESSDSREIAQYHFQMGLAYSFDKRFPEAIESFKKSVEIIENRISVLKHKIENKLTAKDLGIELEDKTEADEVQELTALLPELQEKITDTIDAERESQAQDDEEKQEKEIILRNSPVKNPNPPAANDISHLVKKKKKADDIIDERPVKKLCTEKETTPASIEPETKDNLAGGSAPKDQAPASTTNGHPIAIDA